MRYAILSDIHANLEALTAVLECCSRQRIDRYLCLGDLVGYGANPEECLTRLQELDAMTVAGNHDWACIGKLDPKWFNAIAKDALLWTRDRLSFADLDYLRRLPLTQSDDPVTLVHATLAKPESFTYLVDMAHAVETAKLCRTRFCLVGHTHKPLVFEFDRERNRAGRILSGSELGEVPLGGEAGLRYVINPGSVGQPRDGDPRAAAAVLDTDAKTVTFHRVAYDVAAAQRKITDAGLPPFLAERLALGR